MARTKLFVSYSHEDRVWLNRFSQHIAELQRRGLVELWSDARIATGANWENEIDVALTEAKVAVLLISPAFLASEWIWTKEMPQIIAHAANGMDLLPLVARPCAWRLEPHLARFQARPAEDRALSQGSDSQADADLSAFAYELAARVGRSPTLVSSAQSGLSVSGPASLTDDFLCLIGEWKGMYNGARSIQLTIQETSGNSFGGRMAYPREGTVTAVEGTLHEVWPLGDVLWAQIDDATSSSDRIAVSFRETAYEHKGSSSIDFEGEYRAIVAGTAMSGAWFSETRLVGKFSLQRAIRRGV